jgi:hypothetical protein
LVDGTEMESSFYLKDLKTKYVGNDKPYRVCTNAE